MLVMGAGSMVQIKFRILKISWLERLPKRRSQRASKRRHKPHGEPNMHTHSPLRVRVIITRHRGSVFLQPSLFLTQATLEIPIPRDDECVGF
jgi:hypothetical protein